MYFRPFIGYFSRVNSSIYNDRFQVSFHRAPAGDEIDEDAPKTARSCEAWDDFLAHRHGPGLL